jgi:hypothetical protein
VGFEEQPDAMLSRQGLGREKEDYRHAVVLLEFAKTHSQNSVVIYYLDAGDLRLALNVLQ